MRGHAFSMSRPDRSRCFTSFPLGDICVGVSSAVRVVGRRRGGGAGRRGRNRTHGQAHCRFMVGSTSSQFCPVKRQSGRSRVHEVATAQARHGTAEKCDVTNARRVRACSTTCALFSFFFFCQFFSSSVALVRADPLCL